MGPPGGTGTGMGQSAQGLGKGLCPPVRVARRRRKIRHSRRSMNRETQDKLSFLAVGGIKSGKSEPVLGPGPFHLFEHI